VDTKGLRFEYGRTLEDTKGHERTRPRLEFGTVRPRVLIPGPRPISEFKIILASQPS
jgi:hypothetical protein